MTTILGLFGRTESESLPFDNDPAAANAQLDRQMSAIAHEIESAKLPILYRLRGPEPSLATPMRYGGFFLERDRELLTMSNQRGETWLWVDAGADAYLDFVSDLPAEVLAWDAQKTGFPLAEMRKLRSGRLSTNQPGSDVEFAPGEWSSEVATVGK